MAFRKPVKCQKLESLQSRIVRLDNLTRNLLGSIHSQVSAMVEKEQLEANQLKFKFDATGKPTYENV